MKLLVVADLHYSLPQYDWLTEIAGAFDVVVIAGDHLDLSSLVDGRAQSLVIRKYFGRLKERTRLIVCSGNHDLDSRSAAGEKVTEWIHGFSADGLASDGDSVALGDTLFTVCPWWDGPLVRADIAAQLAADAPKRPKRWIWVHHAPPAHSPVSWAGNRYFGDTELEEWIALHRPDIVFSGHVHQSPFSQGGSWVDRMGATWVFNAGHQFGAPPAFIILDTDQDAALWFSAAGNQMVRLDQPLVRPVAKLAELPDWLTSAGLVDGPSPGQIRVAGGA
jgi:Icc-related predicted phosphoesterase